MKKLVEPGLIVLIALLMIVTAAVNMAPHLGLTIGNIASGSMAPTFNAGTLIIAGRVNPEQLVKGDIIVFHPSAGNRTRVCHRILAVINSVPLSFQTKGDNNLLPDSTAVSAQDVTGRVNFHLPFLGHIVQFLQSSIGLALGLVAPAVIISALCLRSLRKELVKWIKGKAARETGRE
jgi:signal peptidase